MSNKDECVCHGDAGHLPGCPVHGMFIARNTPLFKKYVALPVVVEAFKYDGEPLSLPGFTNPQQGPKFLMGPCLQTPEGTMRVLVNDWIVRGTEGELYICKDSIFKKKYTEVK